MELIGTAVVLLLMPLTLIAGIGWAIACRRPFALAVGVPLQAVSVAVTTVMLLIYAADEDPHSDDGTSRWIGEDAQGVTATAVFLGFVAGALLLTARRTRRRDLAVGGFLTSAVAVLVQFSAVVANTPIDYD